MYFCQQSLTHTSMNVEIVDIAQWDKGPMFERYQELGKYPIISCSVEVDVTRIHKAARRERTRFWLMFIHALGQTLNHFVAFRHRVVLGQVLRFDRIHVRLATLDKERRYYFMLLPLAGSLTELRAAYKAEKRRMEALPVEERETPTPPNCFVLNILPQVRLLGFDMNFISPEGLTGIPYLYAGKPEEDWKGRWKLTLSIQFNHSLLDGDDWQQAGLYLEQHEW